MGIVEPVDVAIGEEDIGAGVFVVFGVFAGQDAVGVFEPLGRLAGAEVDVGTMADEVRLTLNIGGLVVGAGADEDFIGEIGGGVKGDERIGEGLMFFGIDGYGLADLAKVHGACGSMDVFVNGDDEINGDGENDKKKDADDFQEGDDKFSVRPIWSLIGGVFIIEDGLVLGHGLASRVRIVMDGVVVGDGAG